MTKPVQTGAIAAREQVQEMFGRIAPRYDLMNRIMTGGQDIRWRELTVSAATAVRCHKDARRRNWHRRSGVGPCRKRVDGQVVGLDFSAPMIAISRIEKEGRAGSLVRRRRWDAPPLRGWNFCRLHDLVWSSQSSRLRRWDQGDGPRARTWRPTGRAGDDSLSKTRSRSAVQHLFHPGCAKNRGRDQRGPLGLSVSSRFGRRISGRDFAGCHAAASGFQHSSWQKLGGGTVAMHTAVK